MNKWAYTVWQCFQRLHLAANSPDPKQKKKKKTVYDSRIYHFWVATSENFV